MDVGHCVVTIHTVTANSDRSSKLIPCTLWLLISLMTTSFSTLRFPYNMYPCIIVMTSPLWDQPTIVREGHLGDRRRASGRTVTDTGPASERVRPGCSHVLGRYSAASGHHSCAVDFGCRACSAESAPGMTCKPWKSKSIQNSPLKICSSQALSKAWLYHNWHHQESKRVQNLNSQAAAVKGPQLHVRQQAWTMGTVGQAVACFSSF